MPLLAERRPCLNCGKKARRPDSVDAFTCPHCGMPGPWASSDQIEAWNHRQQARSRYAAALGAVANGSDIAAQELAQLAPLAGYTTEERTGLHVQAFVPVASRLIEDQILTPDENRTLSNLLATLAIDWEAVRRRDPALPVKALVSAVNGGILPEVAQPHILPKKGEIIHLEVACGLMKEVAIREYRGGYSGFSIPIGKTGVRYKVGGTRGRIVQLGTRLEVADGGILAVTNKRAVFMGNRKTIDMPLQKLANLGVFTDGVQFHMSNRVNAPLFQIDEGGDVVAAVVNAAAQRLE